MATYYVSKEVGASDSNSGLTELLPWLTINKVNNSTFVSGDRIQFRGGDTWRENLQCPGNNLTFSSYGATGRAILSGATVKSGFTDGGSNIWDVSGVTVQPRIVWVSETRGTLKASRAACTAPGDWFWAANVLSVYALSDPSGNVEAGELVNVFDTNDKTGGTVVDLIIKRSNGALIANDGGGLLIKYSSNGWTVNGCLLTDNFAAGCLVAGATNGFTMIVCTLTLNGAYGLKINGTVDNLSCTWNSFSQNGWDPTISGPGDFEAALHSGDVSHNTFTASGCVGQLGLCHCIYLDPGQTGGTVTVHHNVIHDHAYGSAILCKSGATVYFNSITTSYGGIEVGSNGATANTTTLHHNTIAGNTTLAGVRMYLKGAGALTLNGYHNTLYHNVSELVIASDVGTAGVLDWRNNIMYATDATGLAVSLDSALTVITMDYNCGYGTAAQPFNKTGTPYTFAGWQGLGYEAHGSGANPLFVNAAGGDFHLQSGSPCRDTGVAITGVNDEYHGTHPDMGANEYITSGWTTHGLWLVLSWFRGAALPTNFYVALCDSTTEPTVDTDTKGELTEIPNGNGYTTGGVAVAKNATDFDVLTEDDANVRAGIQLKDIVWTASGNFPASGAGARWAILTDDNGTQGSRIVLAYFDLVYNRNISDGKTLTLQDFELRLE